MLQPLWVGCSHLQRRWARRTGGRGKPPHHSQLHVANHGPYRLTVSTAHCVVTPLPVLLASSARSTSSAASTASLLHFAASVASSPPRLRHRRHPPIHLRPGCHPSAHRPSPPHPSRPSPSPPPPPDTISPHPHPSPPPIPRPPPPSNCPPLPFLPSPPSSGHSAPAELADPLPLRGYSRHPPLLLSPSSPPPPPPPPCSPASTAAGRRAERRMSVNARAALVPLRAARAHIAGASICVPSFTPPPSPCSSGGVDSPASPLQPPVHPLPMKAFAVLDPPLPALIPPTVHLFLHQSAGRPLLSFALGSTSSSSSAPPPLPTRRSPRLGGLGWSRCDEHLPTTPPHPLIEPPQLLRATALNAIHPLPTPPSPSPPPLTPFGPSPRQGVCCPRPALPQVTPPVAHTFAHQTAGRARLFFFSFQPPPTPPSLLLPTRRPFQLSTSQELCR